MNKKIDNINEIPDEKLIKENIRFYYLTGHSRFIRKDPQTRRVKSSYRSGRLTPIGDLAETVWREAVYLVIEKRRDHRLFDLLLQIYKNRPSPALREDYEDQALSVYANEIYKDPKWVGYDDFWREYHQGR